MYVALVPLTAAGKGIVVDILRVHKSIGGFIPKPDVDFRATYRG